MLGILFCGHGSFPGVGKGEVRDIGGGGGCGTLMTRNPGF